MADVVAIRIDPRMLKRIDKLSREEVADRSTLIRRLIRKGYKELLKEKAAQMYIEGKLTLSESAHRASLTLWDMERYLVDKGFKSEYSIEDLEKELALLHSGKTQTLK